MRPDLNISIAPPAGILTPYTDLQVLFNNAITLVFMVALILVLIMLLWGGIQWIMSGGEKERIEKARGRIVNALIGLAVLAFAFLIINVVGQLVGIKEPFKINLPTPGPAVPVVQTQTGR